MMRYKLLYLDWDKPLEEMEVCVESDELKTKGYAVADRADKEFIVWDTYENTLKFVGA